MTSLFRVTVAAEADQPVAESTIQELLDEVSASLPGGVSGDDAGANVVLRGDRHGFTLVLLVEAESSDDAVHDVEQAARAAMARRDEAGDGARLEQVRAEPAYAP